MPQFELSKPLKTGFLVAVGVSLGLTLMSGAMMLAVALFTRLMFMF